MANNARVQEMREQHDRVSNENRVQTQSNGRNGSSARESRSTERERQIRTTREDGAQEGRVESRRNGAGRSRDALSWSTMNASPFALMSRMMDDMDRLLEDFGLGPTLGTGRGTLLPRTGGTERSQLAGGREQEVTRARWAPQLEAFTRDGSLVIRADLPGMKKEDIDVSVQDGYLTISGERRNEFEDRQDGFYHSERSYGSFFRSIPLPEGSDGEAAEASFKDGVLEITLPLPKQEENRRRIEIR